EDGIRVLIVTGVQTCSSDLENVAFKRLGLAVVDEQHRFGVRQRATFREKGTGSDPHLLLTTATPIPQTLNQTIYRDLDISLIKEIGRASCRESWEIALDEVL